MKNFPDLRATLLLFALAFASLLNGCGLPSGVKVIRNREYARVGDRSLKLDIYAPRMPVGRLPVVIWIHGGSWKSGNKNFCPIGFMAGRNVAVVSIDYRLSAVASFPAPLYDCKGAVRWLRANAARYDLDADHIGVAGASAGGHLGLLLATTGNHPELEGDVGGNLNYSSRIQCVCALYPPTDLNRLVTDPMARTNVNADVAKFIGGAVADNPDKAKAASPLTYVDRTCAPVYLLHGGADILVPPEQSEWFYNSLTNAGVAARLFIVPGKGHGITAPPDAAKEIEAFYDRYLKPGTGEK
jgi:acetyl esterase/lipase